MEVVNMATYIINLLGNFLELLIVIFFLKDSFKPRFKKLVFIPLCVIITLFQFLNTNLFLAKSSFLILGSVIFLFFLLLLYDIRWQNRMAYLFFLFAIIGCSEIIITMLLTSIFTVDVSFIQNNIPIFATATVASKFLAYFFVLITKKKRIISSDTRGKQIVGLLFSLPIASLLIILLFIRCCYQISDITFEIITLTTSIVLAFANVSVFYIIDKQNELIETKEKLLFVEKHINSQVIHYEELYKHQNELRTFRHDIKNKSILLIALLKKGETEKALRAIENNIDWLEKNNNSIINSGNPIIDAVLQAKLYDAKEKSISIAFSTKLVEEIKIDEIELGIIIGNALDNAIEATEKCKEKDNLLIQFNLIVTSDRISISVKNPVKKDVNTEKLQTTKDDKINHGFGINSMRTLANKYDGMIIFSCINKIFTVNINLSNQPLDTFAL